MTAVRRLELTGPLAGTVGRCRDFAFNTLVDWCWLPSLDRRRQREVDDVLLVVSELVANACLHAGGPTELALYREPDRIRIEVTDRSPALPDPAPPADPATPRGHGLRVVALVASEWGARPALAGKTVWAGVAGAGPRGAGGGRRL
ncbi:ATP-binding protein [Kitasatospora azatica]|uniref:ATP-binding protein n=1 Tax=Kitasatospora azatica TaxID=58347 RepID=UPI0005671403|nr:ATP-binding protein [Kitasatospora azatica]